ncbi:MAG TPA: hypothetical protein VM554_01625 [Acidisarcina sp.]|nr:hypothetical protein [Acidisarcina sp.]
MNRLRARRAASGILTLLLAAVLAVPVPVHAQGCSMCRDTAAGSAPQVRRSLRVAIPVLGIPALVLFLAMLGVAFRFRAKTDA